MFWPERDIQQAPNDEGSRRRRTLDWATAGADSCEQRFRGALCTACVEQDRRTCALAEYARRLVADRYGLTNDQTPIEADESTRTADEC